MINKMRFNNNQLRNKPKVMVISSRQIAQYHQLDSSNKVNIKCNNKNIARVKEYKLLDIILDELFELHSHVNTILKDGYFTLRTLKLLKRYTSYYLRKQRCESLVLSKLDYCNILFKTLLQYQIKQSGETSTILCSFR